VIFKTAPLTLNGSKQQKTLTTQGVLARHKNLNFRNHRNPAHSGRTAI
jgi:hypothetical protein